MDRKTKLLIAIGIVVVVLAAAAIGVVVAGLLTNWFRGNEPSTRVRVFATNRTHMFQEVAALTLSKGEQPSLENKVSIKQESFYPDDRPITGFGAALTDASAYLLRQMPEAVRKDVLNRLFAAPEAGGMGLNYVRVTCSASDFSLRFYTYDDMPPGQTDPNLNNFKMDAADEYIIPAMREILKVNPEVRVMLSPWTAPPWMKTIESYFGAVNGTGARLDPKYYGAYAKFWVKTLQAYGERGVPVHAITLQNEPLHNPSTYPGLLMNSSEQLAFINDHLAPALDAAAVQVEVWLYDHNWDDIDYATHVFLNLNTVARKFVVGAAFHCYGGDVSAQSVFHERTGGRARIMHTECSGGSWAPVWADNFVWDLRHLFVGAVNNRAEGSLKWNLILDQKHGPALGGCLDCRGLVTFDTRDNTVTYNEDAYSTGLMSSFVRRGTRRVQTSIEPLLRGPLVALAVAPATDPNGQRTAVVVNTEKKDVRFTLELVPQSGDATLREWLHTDIPAQTALVFRW